MGVALLSDVTVSMTSIYSASCPTYSAVLSSPGRFLPIVARYHVFATSFLIVSDSSLTSHPVTSWLVPMLSISPSGSVKWHTIISWPGNIVGSLSITHISWGLILGIENVSSMIEVIFLYVGLVALPGLLFRIKSYVSTNLSSLATSLVSPWYIFHSWL